MDKPSQAQVGGDHYRRMFIQPIEFIQKNRLSYEQGNIIKYICRYRSKNGREDLEKIKHYVDLIIEHEYPDLIIEHECHSPRKPSANGWV